MSLPSLTNGGTEDRFLPVLNNRFGISRETAYRCDVCDKYYASYKSYGNHIRSYHGKNKEKAKCPYCGNCFTRRDNLQQHIKLFHCSVKKEFLCKYCKEAFLNRSSCSKHKLSCPERQKYVERHGSDAPINKTLCNGTLVDADAEKNNRYSSPLENKKLGQIEFDRVNNKNAQVTEMRYLNFKLNEGRQPYSTCHKNQMVKRPLMAESLDYTEVRKEQVSRNTGYQYSSELSIPRSQYISDRSKVIYRGDTISETPRHMVFMRRDSNNFIFNKADSDPYPRKVIVQRSPHQSSQGKHEEIFKEYVATIRNMSLQHRLSPREFVPNQTTSLFKERSNSAGVTSKAKDSSCEMFNNDLTNKVYSNIDSNDHAEANDTDEYEEGSFESTGDIANVALDCAHCNITFLTRQDYEDHKPFCAGHSSS